MPDRSTKIARLHHHLNIAQVLLVELSMTDLAGKLDSLHQDVQDELSTPVVIAHGTPEYVSRTKDELSR